MRAPQRATVSAGSRTRREDLRVNVRPSTCQRMLKPRSPRDSLLDEAYWRLRYLLSCGRCQNVATGRFGRFAAAKEKARTPASYWHPSGCDPNRIRTGVTAVRGQRTRPLYDGAVTTTLRVCHMARRPAKQRYFAAVAVFAIGSVATTGGAKTLSAPGLTSMSIGSAANRSPSV